MHKKAILPPKYLHKVSESRAHYQIFEEINVVKMKKKCLHDFFRVFDIKSVRTTAWLFSSLFVRPRRILSSTEGQSFFFISSAQRK